MMMNKVFNKYMDGGVGRINAGRECNYKLRISVYFTVDKLLLLPWWKNSSVINLNLLSVGCSFPPENDAISRNQPYSLLLICWICVSNVSQINLGKTNSVQPFRPCCPGPLVRTRPVGKGGRLTSVECVLFVYLITESLICRRCTLMANLIAVTGFTHSSYAGDQPSI